MDGWTSPRKLGPLERIQMAPLKPPKKEPQTNVRSPQTPLFEMVSHTCSKLLAVPVVELVLEDTLLVTVLDVVLLDLTVSPRGSWCQEPYKHPDMARALPCEVLDTQEYPSTRRDLSHRIPCVGSYPSKSWTSLSNSSGFYGVFLNLSPLGEQWGRPLVQSKNPVTIRNLSKGSSNLVGRALCLESCPRPEPLHYDGNQSFWLLENAWWINLKVVLRTLYIWYLHPCLLKIHSLTHTHTHTNVVRTVDVLLLEVTDDVLPVLVVTVSVVSVPLARQKFPFFPLRWLDLLFQPPVFAKAPKSLSLTCLVKSIILKPTITIKYHTNEPCPPEFLDVDAWKSPRVILQAFHVLPSQSLELGPHFQSAEVSFQKLIIPGGLCKKSSSKGPYCKYPTKQPNDTPAVLCPVTVVLLELTELLVVEVPKKVVLVVRLLIVLLLTVPRFYSFAFASLLHR